MTYDHLCENCNREFQAEYSIKDDPPTKCPLCNFDGKVKRLISAAAPGKVELTGNELTAHIKEDAKRIQREAAKNEKLYASLLGEGRMQQVQQKIDRQKRGW